MFAATEPATPALRPGPPGTRFAQIRWFTEIDSTNRYLVDEARAGAPEGLVAVADHQSAGRGRLGRRWEAPAGDNLLVSVLLRPGLPDEELHLCTAAVALAAAEACERTAGVVPELKWPNDLFVGDRKLAGVLAESVPAVTVPVRSSPVPATTGAPSTAAAGRAVVVGVGLNVGWPPPDGVAGRPPVPEELRPIATSLWRESGTCPDVRVVLDVLLGALEPLVGDLADRAGRRRLAAAYRSRCTTLGKVVQVTTAEGTVRGTAVDVTVEGHLVVDVGACFKTVAAGDVVVLRAGS